MRPRSAPQRTSHRHPAGPGLSARLASRSGLLLTLAVALAVLAAGALVLPGTPGTRTVDAAAVRTLAATDGRSAAACRLEVPRSPLTAHGLATPYRLRSKNWLSGDCHETDPRQAAFVEAVIYDPAAHSLAVYHPLVVDDGAQPAARPVPVALPANAVVGLWVGFNGATLDLTGPGAGRCVDGVAGSSFGHFAYCNAPAFFAAVTRDSQVVVPPVGTGRDGLPCPTSRDFSVVDQHQADYVTTAYRVIGGRIAQDTGTTPRGTTLTNVGGRLLSGTLDPALGCRPFTAPDLTAGGTPTTALALDELSAAANQPRPAALVPGSDPLVRGAHGRTSVRKTNLYRAGVDQAPFPSGQSRSGYCTKILAVAPARLQTDAAILRAAPSPVAEGQDLLSYLSLRLQATLHGLGCPTSAAVRELAARADDGISRSTRSDVPAEAAGTAPSAAPAITSAQATSGPAESFPSSGSAELSPGGSAERPPPADGSTLWGSSVMAYGGESFARALARVQQTLHPQIIRYYDPGAPSWPTATGNLPLVISFKIPPAQVLDGSHDAQLRAFFAATPRQTYWSYWHEPEDDIARGEFTAADYRAAWTHIAVIARASGRPLVSTLILMGWTTIPASHRTWTDYYAGPGVIDVLGWDPYLFGRTSTPASVFDPVRAASVAAGKPWAIAETGVGSMIVTDPAQRQAVLTETSHYLATATPKPVFVTYFDSDPDAPNIQFGWNISSVPAAAAAWMAGESG